MANIQLAKNLLYLRTLYNLKQDDIANLFNITRQACSRNGSTGKKVRVHPILMFWLLLLLIFT